MEENMREWPPIRPGRRFMLLVEVLHWDLKNTKIAVNCETLPEAERKVKEIKAKVRKGHFRHRDAKFNVLKYTAEEVSISEIIPKEKLFK